MEIELPTGNDGVPTGNDGIPTVNDGVPTGNDGVPTGNDGIPTGNDGVPTGNDGIPTGNDGIPTGNDGIPTGNDVTPTGNDVTPTGNDVTPTGNDVDPPLTDIEIPLTDIDVPSNGPELLRPPSVEETNTNPPEPGNTDQSLIETPNVTDPPAGINPENQDAEIGGAGLVGATAQEAAGLAPGLGVVPAPTPEVVVDSSSTSGSSTQDNANKPSGANAIHFFSLFLIL